MSRLDISDAWLASLDDGGDIDALRKAIVAALTDPQPKPAACRWIAALLSDDANTFARLDLAQRRQGNADDRRKGAETFELLWDIYLDTPDPRRFAAVAVKKTGLHENTVRKYKKAIEDALAAGRDA